MAYKLKKIYRKVPKKYDNYSYKMGYYQGKIDHRKEKLNELYLPK